MARPVGIAMMLPGTPIATSATPSPVASSPAATAAPKPPFGRDPRTSRMMAAVTLEYVLTTPQ